MPQAVQPQMMGPPPGQGQGGGGGFDPKSIFGAIGAAGQMVGLPAPVSAAFGLLGGQDPMQVMQGMMAPPGSPPPGMPPGGPGGTPPGSGGQNPFLMSGGPPGMPGGGGPGGPPPGMVVPGGSSPNPFEGPPPQMMA